MLVEIVPVTSKKEKNIFVKFPWQIYRENSNWVPPLLIDIKTVLNRTKNPFFLHSDAELFLAYRNGDVVGRIAAILNNNHNQTHDEKTGFFGFFECIEDTDAAAALLHSAEKWLQAKGMQRMRGPMNFSTNDTCGFLLEGFDQSPAIMMPYNPPYYLELMRNCGLKIIKRMFAYYLTDDIPMPERFMQFAKKAKANPSLRFRTIDMADFKNEVERVFEIYNDAWQNNWGFVPMTREEFLHIANDLKLVIDPKIVYIVEVDGEPAGFSLALPDFNIILKHLNGRLLPFGIFKLLLNKRKIHSIRLLTLGVKQKFQSKRGIAPALYYETYTTGTAKGYNHGEFSWVLEDNTLMNRALENMGAKISKKYAIVEKTI